MSAYRYLPRSRTPANPKRRWGGAGDDAKPTRRAASLGVVLLCHFDGTNGSTVFTDASPLAHTLTPTSTTVSTAGPKFGTGAGDFSASTAARIDTGNATDFQFGSGQFTVEAWVKATGTLSSVQAVVTQSAGGSNRGWYFGTNSGGLYFWYSTTGADFPAIGSSFAPVSGTWYHVAADRDASNILRIYVNGVVIASSNLLTTVIFPATANCMIGNDTAAATGWPGQLDDVRVTKGIAQYGGAFTPPSAPLL